jgi:SAM-dependent methyltransferase
VPTVASRRQLWQLFLAEKRDPEPFYRELAQRTLAEFPFPVAGGTVVDLGSGPGHYTRALRAAGARVLPVDLDPAEFELPGGPPGDETVASGAALPVRTGTVDGVFCSNMLEHTPHTAAVLGEIERVLRPGGWAWVSWTNWFSPWGGHEITPWHYLGPRWGTAVHSRLRGAPRKNVPGEGLFPVHVGATLREVRRRSELELIDAVPRYWPSQRWITRVPGLREVATWNCVLLMRRTWN